MDDEVTITQYKQGLNADILKQLSVQDGLFTLQAFQNNKDERMNVDELAILAATIETNLKLAERSIFEQIGKTDEQSYRRFSREEFLERKERLMQEGKCLACAEFGHHLANCPNRKRARAPPTNEEQQAIRRMMQRNSDKVKLV